MKSKIPHNEYITFNFVSFHLLVDYTFPGIGVPATAASGAIAANNLMSIPEHWALLDKIKLPSK